MNLPHLLLSDACCFLFVPANQPERYSKALTSGAQGVIIDLEDAVGLDDKPKARNLLKQHWSLISETDKERIVVRCNAPGSPFYAADSCDENETELDTARFMMTLASKLVSIAPPIDGVTQSTSDVDLIFAHAHKARRFGFGAKLCIHPKQIPVVKQAFTPTPQEVDWAQRVIAADKASGGQAAKVDGKMIDRPVVMLARRILSLAGNP
jgi:citrate lyase beta subunit